MDRTLTSRMTLVSQAAIVFACVWEPEQKLAGVQAENPAELHQEAPAACLNICKENQAAF